MKKAAFLIVAGLMAGSVSAMALVAPAAVAGAAQDAEIKVGEVQARDVEFGQKVVIDTRNGFVPGRVVRIDPIWR